MRLMIEDVGKMAPKMRYWLASKCEEAGEQDYLEVKNYGKVMTRVCITRHICSPDLAMTCRSRSCLGVGKRMPRYPCPLNPRFALDSGANGRAASIYGVSILILRTTYVLRICGVLATG
jgi:hypothetical protein